MGVNSPFLHTQWGPPLEPAQGDNVGSGQPSAQTERKGGCIIKMGEDGGEDGEEEAAGERRRTGGICFCKTGESGGGGSDPWLWP